MAESIQTSAAACLPVESTNCNQHSEVECETQSLPVGRVILIEDCLAHPEQYPFAPHVIGLEVLERLRRKGEFHLRIAPPNWIKSRTFHIRIRGDGIIGRSHIHLIERPSPLPSGSLAESAARSGRPEYAEKDGIAVVAKPVMWKGRVAKVAVVAVNYGDRAVLAPQICGADRQ